MRLCRISGYENKKWKGSLECYFRNKIYSIQGWIGVEVDEINDKREGDKGQ